MHHRLLLVPLIVAGCGKADHLEPPQTPAPTPTAPTAPTATPAGAPTKAPTKAASRGAERSVYSLVDNRLSAHLTRGGGLLLPGGSAGFAKYVRFSNQIAEGTRKSWELRATDGSVKVAKMNGRQASVFVPLSKEQAQRGVVRLRVHSKADGWISLQINGNEKKEIKGKAAKGWATVEIEAASQLVEGENSIQISAKDSGATVAWIQIGAKTSVAEDGSVAFYDTTAKALTIPQDSAMTWFVVVPEKGRVTGDLSDGNCTVTVSARAEDGTHATGKLVGVGSAVDLASLSGKAVRLDLDASGCDRAALTNAALVVPGSDPVVKRGDAPKHVVFVIMDSLRADRVKPFNPKARADVPTFDKLTESSTVFLDHYVQGTESQVSHASMWTSLYLAKHKASQMEHKLPDKWVTIDEVAKKAKHYVAGVSANGYIRPQRGFGSGWDKFHNHITSGGGLKAEQVFGNGLSFVEKSKDKPWFLYVGLIDTHVTWRPKSPWIEKYDPGYKGRFQREFGDEPNGFPPDVTDREKEHVRAIYDSNVSYQDDQLGKFIEKLKAWGVWDQTMLIITADHGDELWEDGTTIGHGRTPRETIAHVPMLIHYPPMFPAAKIRSGTEGIDIVPTIADALGVPMDGEWQGASMIPLANGQQAYVHMSVASQYENFHVGRIGSWKVRIAGVGSPQVYNLSKDPGEKKNLWGDKSAGIGARLLLDPMWMLRQWNVEWKKSQWGNAASVSNKFATDLGE
jgi:arylsulfatase A-like enzyme